MVAVACGRTCRVFVAGLLVIGLVSLGLLPGCVDPKPSGVVSSSLEPPALTVLNAGGGNLALGPFDTPGLSYGWLPGEPDRVWGWGPFEDSREQFYFTLGTDGTLEAMRIPESLALAYPVPAPGACLGVHYGEGAWKAWRLPFEGPPTELCPAEAERESPSGNFVLWFGLVGGTVLYDKRSGALTPVAALPSWGFPYSSGAATWVDDTLVVVRYGDEAAHGRGLEFVRLPDGAVMGRQVRPGHSLFPYASPDGKWLAVLASDRVTTTSPEEAVLDSVDGQELTVYPRDALGARGSGIPLAIPSGRLATSLVWAPDGSRLAFAVVWSVERAEGLLAADTYRGPASVCLATAPAFETKTLTLDGSEDPWFPGSLSPDGRYLTLSKPRGAEGKQRPTLIWDVEADRAVTLSPSQPGAVLDVLDFPVWVAPDLFLSRETVGDEEFRVLVDLSTGKALRLPWPGPWYRAASAGGYIALNTLVGPGEPLGPFGRVAPGYYLVLSPLRGR